MDVVKKEEYKELRIFTMAKLLLITPELLCITSSLSTPMISGNFLKKDVCCNPRGSVGRWYSMPQWSQQDLSWPVCLWFAMQIYEGEFSTSSYNFRQCQWLILYGRVGTVTVVGPVTVDITYWNFPVFYFGLVYWAITDKQYSSNFECIEWTDRLAARTIQMPYVLDRK